MMLLVSVLLRELLGLTEGINELIVELHQQLEYHQSSITNKHGQLQKLACCVHIYTFIVLCVG